MGIIELILLVIVVLAIVGALLGKITWDRAIILLIVVAVIAFAVWFATGHKFF